MGLIPRLFGFLFGDGRNVIADAAKVFRVGADAADARAADAQSAALAQFAAEFSTPRKGLFDRMIDGLNRVPRPAMAIGTIALFVSAMTHPVWFSERMQGIALVPEPLWWLLGVVVSFYFGARHQAKGQEFQRSIAETLARAPQVVRNIEALRALEPGAPDEPAEPANEAPQGDEPIEENAALKDWATRRSEGQMS